MTGINIEKISFLVINILNIYDFNDFNPFNLINVCSTLFKIILFVTHRYSDPPCGTGSQQLYIPNLSFTIESKVESVYQ